MPVYEILFETAPGDDALVAALAGAFETDPGAVIFLGDVIGENEAGHKNPVIVSRHKIAGDFVLHLSASVHINGFSREEIAARLAERLGVRVILADDGGESGLMAEPSGEARQVRIGLDEETGDTRVADAVS